MRENTPESGVELRGTDTEPLPRGADEDATDPEENAATDSGEQTVLRVSVPVVNPQSNTRDSFVDGDVLVGRIPVASADTPCADDLLDAAVVTVLEERVTAYYPRPDEERVVALVWEAATDDWRCEEFELSGEFDVDGGRRDDDEAILWEEGEPV